MDQLYMKLDVTSVAFFGNVVLAGVGGLVYVFCVQKKSILSSRCILKRYKIRGFSCTSGEEALCFGGNEVGVFKVVEDKHELNVIECVLLKNDDWIIYSKWVDSDSNVVTLSAHNLITLWNWKERNKIWRIACREQNILYSGFIFGNISVDLICLGGTVFGEIEVWSVHGKEFENISDKRPVLHHLTGHKGAVFSVTYSEENQYICSTSDDRSVRWWKVLYTDKEVSKENQSLFQQWSTAEIIFTTAAYGHLSRVWKCVSADSSTLTVGEDSQICLWKSHDAGNIKTKNMGFSLVARKQILHGGSIWSLDFSPTYGVAVGLEDGSIILWNISSLLSKSVMISLNPLEKSKPFRRVCLFEKNLRLIVITKSGEVLISAKKNLTDLSWQNILNNQKFIGLSLLQTSQDRKSVAITSSNGDVVVLSGNEDLRCVASMKLQEGYALSIHWLAKDLLLTCGIKGKLQLWLIYQEREIDSLEELGYWILPFSKQRWTTSALWIPFGAPPGILICSNRTGDLLLYQGNCKDPLQVFRNIHGHMGVTSFSLLNYKNSTRELKYEYWMPSYSETFMNCQHTDKNDRERNTIIYSTGRDGVLKSFVVRSERLKIRGCEQLGFEWAARCFVLNEKIFVFGFKGAYAVIWGVQERSVLLERECGGGHRSWDLDIMQNNQEIMHIQMALIKNGSLCVLKWHFPSDGFLKSVLQEGLHSKEVYCVKWLNIISGIRMRNKSSSSLILLSGSEDTTAKVNLFHPSGKGDSYDLTTVNTLCGHLSSVRTLSLLPIHNIIRPSDMDPEDLHGKNRVVSDEEKIPSSVKYLVFTAGGRAQLKVWKLCFDMEVHDELGSICNIGICRAIEKSSMFLGNRKYGEKEVLTDAEARFMEVCALSSISTDDKTLVIPVAAACSDGILRIFGFQEYPHAADESRKKSALRLYFQGFPHPPPSKRHCLFRVSHCIVKEQHLLITTDTMGYFHLWDVTSLLTVMKSSLWNEDVSINNSEGISDVIDRLEPIFIKLAHNFSINALDWLEITKNSNFVDNETRLSSYLLLATGGEDGALGMNVLRLSREKDDDTWTRVEVQNSWKDKLAMSTQISALKFIGNKYLVTVTKGQQVSLWSWKCDLEDFSISASIVHQYFTSVADIQDVEVIQTMNGTFIGICGCGIEVLKLSISEDKE